MPCSEKCLGNYKRTLKLFIIIRVGTVRYLQVSIRKKIIMLSKKIVVIVDHDHIYHHYVYIVYVLCYLAWLHFSSTFGTDHFTQRCAKP